MRTVKNKYIFPMAHKMTYMMSRTTPNIADNQQASVAENLEKLNETLSTWVDHDDLPNPYELDANFTETAKEIRRTLTTKNSSVDDPILHTPEGSHFAFAEMDNMYQNAGGDAYEFAQEALRYFDEHGMRDAYEAFSTYVDVYPGDSIDEYYSQVDEILHRNSD